MTEPIFNLDIEIKVLNKLKKLFEIQEHPLILTEQDLNKDIMVLSQDNIYAIISKTKQSRELLLRFANEIRTIPALEYSNNNDFNQNFRGYDIKYLYPIIDFFNIFKSKNMDSDIATITLSLKNNYPYPMTLENPYFKFIIAPKIKSD